MCRLARNSNKRFSETMNARLSTNDPPYQMLGKLTLASCIGLKELSYVHFWIALLTECISCALYVFVVCSTRISWTGSLIGHEPNLIAMALSSGISMTLLLYAFRSVHVSPAITIAFLVTGKISLVRAIAYILVQSLGSVASIAFLYSVSVKGHAGALGLDNPHHQLLSWQILVVEIVISFIVTFTTFATSSYSSYNDAKQFILNQISLQHDKQQYNQQRQYGSRRSRRSIAPIVSTHNPSSISIINTGHNSHSRSSSNNVGKDLLSVNGPSCIDQKRLYSAQYSQVYEEYTDLNWAPLDQNADNPYYVLLNNCGCSNSNNNSNNSCSSTSHNATSSNINIDANNASKTLHPVSRFSNDFDLTNATNPNGLIKPDSQFEDYDDYDNHRIYATQQLDLISNSNSFESVELAMHEESQLLAPNGFPFRVSTSQALIIGLAYVVTSFAGLPVSGASLNPARSFGPAFIMNRWDKHWIYWLGPIIGSVVASILHEFIFSPTRKSSLCFRPSLFRINEQDVARLKSSKTKQTASSNSSHYKSAFEQTPSTQPRFLAAKNSSSMPFSLQHQQQQQQQQQEMLQQMHATSNRMRANGGFGVGGGVMTEGRNISMSQRGVGGIRDDMNIGCHASLNGVSTSNNNNNKKVISNRVYNM